MKNTKTHGMVAAIEIINAALASNGQAAFKPKFGSFEFLFIQKMYHETRRKLLVELKPEFAVENSEVGMGSIRPLRDLGDGRCVYDVEFVTEFSDEFINAFISELAEKFAPFGNSLTARRGRRRGW